MHSLWKETDGGFLCLSHCVRAENNVQVLEGKFLTKHKCFDFFLTDFIFFPRKSAHTVELFFVFKGETVKRDILKPKLKSPEVPIRISVPLI